MTHRATIDALNAKVEQEQGKFDSFEAEKAKEVSHLTEELERVSKLLKEADEK